MTGAPVRFFEIRDASGRLVAIHGRQERPKGGKRLWWELPDGTKGLGGIALSDLPLYGVERLGDWPDPIVVVEGEKATEALIAVGIAALGTVTGASSCPGPLPLAELTGRRVILWPDNDEPGRGHMLALAQGLDGVAAAVDIVAWVDAPAHGDSADFLAAGGTAQDVRTLLETAQGVPSSPADLSAGWTQREPKGGKRQQAESDRILELAQAAELFHTPGGDPFADVTIDGHRETWGIPSRGLIDWVGGVYWRAYRGAPREAAIKDALHSLAARARHGSPERAVFLRVGSADGVIYLDLADELWQVVEITDARWQVVREPPVRFRRGSSSLALPEPIAGGDVDELRPFVNVVDEAQWRLLLGWAVFAMLPWGPYPPLILGGQQDSGKTTTARVLRALLDPDEAPTTSAPRDDEDIIVTAANVWCPVYDNLSGLDARFSDMLCRLAEGAGLQRRARYTDTDVVTVRARRPVILTGIGDLATSGDLLSRALTLVLPSLADDGRVAETDFWAMLAAARPRILGALCDLVSGVLRERPRVVLPIQPRMADFARVGVALERVCGWPTGSFLAAYQTNRAEGHELVLESSPLVEPLRTLVNDLSGAWIGSSSELLSELERRSGDAAHQRSWPKTASRLSRDLNRLAPSLLSRGVTVERGRSAGGNRDRRWTIEKVSGHPTVPTVPSVAGVAEAMHGSLEVPSQVQSREDNPAVPTTDRGGTERTAWDDDRLSYRPAPSQPDSQLDTTSKRHDANLRDGGDGELTLKSERRKEEAVALVRAALAAGGLDGIRLAIGPGQTVSDAAGFARISLAELSRPGRTGELARERLELLATAIQAADGAA